MILTRAALLLRDIAGIGSAPQLSEYSSYDELKDWCRYINIDSSSIAFWESSSEGFFYFPFNIYKEVPIASEIFSIRFVSS